jgi:hypothetical protein
MAGGSVIYVASPWKGTPVDLVQGYWLRGPDAERDAVMPASHNIVCDVRAITHVVLVKCCSALKPRSKNLGKRFNMMGWGYAIAGFAKERVAILWRNVSKARWKAADNNIAIALRQGSHTGKCAAMAYQDFGPSIGDGHAGLLWKIPAIVCSRDRVSLWLQ